MDFYQFLELQMQPGGHNPIGVVKTLRQLDQQIQQLEAAYLEMRKEYDEKASRPRTPEGYFDPGFETSQAGIEWKKRGEIGKELDKKMWPLMDEIRNLKQKRAAIQASLSVE